ncbi:hypothetical protein C5167_037127 [Papaver somniferum]|uniref:S1-like domain-containing protein n=1 Tax=Papaver somniferum TaxID=3469 RepID=A0A4Y7I967_PAPSO|nr:probable RNA-binding protein EIF1AD [Papaver somniferum]RZC44181.1 hypothetical protein C5167_037127 [Papaver somniferum]
MKGGRKNLKRAAEEQGLTLQKDQCVMQVVSLRGSNSIEVLDANGKKLLALFPAKFQKSMWIKRGSFVVVDAGRIDEAIEAGSKVACIVTQVLFYEQVRLLQKSPDWPEIFKVTGTEESNAHPQVSNSQAAEELNSSEDEDGLPPLEANTNRIRPIELDPEADSESESD